MSFLPDGRICQFCGGPMEVHVDLHCMRCGLKPGEKESEWHRLTRTQEQRSALAEIIAIVSGAGGEEGTDKSAPS